MIQRAHVQMTELTADFSQVEKDVTSVGLLLRLSDHFASAWLAGITSRRSSDTEQAEIELEMNIQPGANIFRLEVLSEDNTTSRNISLTVRRHLELTCDDKVISCRANLDDTGLNSCDHLQCRLKASAFLRDALPPYQPLKTSHLRLTTAAPYNGVGDGYAVDSFYEDSEDSEDLLFTVKASAIGTLTVAVLYPSDITIAGESEVVSRVVACGTGHARPTAAQFRQNLLAPCLSCKSGHFNDEVGSAGEAATCKECPEGTYQPKEGQLSCLPCPIHASSAAGSADGCYAEPGYFMTDLSVSVMCTPQDVCTGQNECLKGYSGLLCGECDFNLCESTGECYYRDSSNSCKRCPDNSLGTLLLMIFGALLFLIFAVNVGVHAVVYAKKDMKGMVSTVTYVQIVSLVGQFELNWPPELLEFFSWFAIFKFNINLAQPECLSPIMRKPTLKFFLQLAMPLILALALILYYCVESLHTWLLKRLAAPLRGCLRERLRWAQETELLVLLGKLKLRDEFCGGPQAATVVQFSSCAGELIELWQIFNMPNVSDKYEESLTFDMRKSLFCNIVLDLSCGDIRPVDISRLLMRVSPLRRRANFDQRRDSLKRERSVILYTRALMKSFKLARSKKRRASLLSKQLTHPGSGSTIDLERHSRLADASESLADKKTANKTPRLSAAKRLSLHRSHLSEKGTAKRDDPSLKANQKALERHLAVQKLLMPVLPDIAARPARALGINATAELQDCTVIFTQAELAVQLAKLHVGRTGTAKQSQLRSQLGAISAEPPSRRDRFLAARLRFLWICYSHEELVALKGSLVSLFVMILQIFYVPLAEVAMQPFACATGADGVRRMTSNAASSVACSWSDPDWSLMAIGGTVATVVFVAGLPLFFACVLYIGYRLAQGSDMLWWRASRHSGMHSQRFEQMLGPLYSGVHSHACLWEVWLMLRKLLLVLLLIFLFQLPDLQLAGTIVVLTVSLGLHLSHRPYISVLEDRLELFDTLLHLSVILAGAIFLSDALRESDDNSAALAGSTTRTNATLAAATSAGRTEGTPREALVIIVLILVALGLVLNGMVLMFNLVVLTSNLIPSQWKQAPSWLRRCCRCCSIDFTNPFVRARREPNAERLKLLPKAMRQLERVFGVGYARQIKPWVQKADKAHIKRCLDALIDLEKFTDSSMYEAVPAIDGRRLAMFLAASSRAQVERLALTLNEQHGWLQRAQQLHAIDRFSRQLSSCLQGVSISSIGGSGGAQVAAAADVAAARMKVATAVDKALTQRPKVDLVEAITAASQEGRAADTQELSDTQKLQAADTFWPTISTKLPADPEPAPGGQRVTFGAGVEAEVSESQKVGRCSLAESACGEKSRRRRSSFRNDIEQSSPRIDRPSKITSRRQSLAPKPPGEKSAPQKLPSPIPSCRTRPDRSSLERAQPRTSRTRVWPPPRPLSEVIAAAQSEPGPSSLRSSLRQSVQDAWLSLQHLDPEAGSGTGAIRQSRLWPPPQAQMLPVPQRAVESAGMSSSRGAEWTV